MIITNHIHKIIQIHPCLLKLSRKQEGVTDGRTDRQTDGWPLLLYPSPPLRGDKYIVPLICFCQNGFLTVTTSKVKSEM